MIAYFFAILPWLAAAVLLVCAAWEYLVWRERRANWREVMAISQGERLGRGDLAPRLAWEFELDGKRHQGLSAYMREKLPAKGERIRVYHDPANPDVSEWFDPAMHLYFMLGSAAIGLLIVWLAW